MHWIRRAACKLIGHKYVVVRRFSPWARKIHCTRCERSFAMHDGVRTVLPWEGDFEDLYKEPADAE